MTTSLTVPFQDRWNETFTDWRLSGALTENYPRIFAGTSDFSPISGTLHVIAGPKLYAGEVINSFTMGVSGTASVTLTHSWFCLVDPSNLSVVCKTADDTAAWNSFGLRTVNMGSPFTITASKSYYIGLLITAATLPTMKGANTTSLLGDVAPRESADSTTGLTTPASLGATAAALTLSAAGSVMPWVGIS